MSATSGDGSLPELEGAFAEWARARRDIRAVMVLGSQARIDHPKHRCDVLMKELLRQMIEWHARATGGPSVDTWHSGHFLEEWADPRAIEGLRSAFAVYDEDDIWRALLVTMELYRWLAQETSEALGYSYPSDADMRIAGLVRQLESGRKSNIP